MTDASGFEDDPAEVDTTVDASYNGPLVSLTWTLRSCKGQPKPLIPGDLAGPNYTLVSRDIKTCTEVDAEYKTVYVTSGTYVYLGPLAPTPPEPEPDAPTKINFREFL